jgi:hypothetical protein
MKTFLATFILLIGVCSITYSQTNEWTVYYDQDGVTISYKIADCDLEMGYDEQRILIKVANTSAKKALVIWQYEQFYDEVCLTCNDPHGEYRKEFCLESGNQIEGKCSVYDSSGLTIFSEWVSQPNESTLTKWDLGNLIVEFPTD